MSATFTYNISAQLEDGSELCFNVTGTPNEALLAWQEMQDHFATCGTVIAAAFLCYGDHVWKSIGV